MELEQFKETFKTFCDSHVQASESQLAENPEWELENPQFFLLFQLDEDQQLVPAPRLLQDAPKDVAAAMMRESLKLLRNTSSDELRTKFQTEDGRHPATAALLAWMMVSEGWEKDPETMARTAEISFATMEDYEYHQGMASWEKKDGKLIPKMDHVEKASYTYEQGTFNNLFDLPPLETEHAH